MRPNAVVVHVSELASMKHGLFEAYRRTGVVLAKKEVPWALGTTWGFWLAEWNEYRATRQGAAASVGEDELKLLFDLCQLVTPHSSFVIGHSFGLSTFCLALSWPEGQVVAIDNWSEAEVSSANRRITAALLTSPEFRNVSVHSGTSPDDTAPILARAGLAERGLSLVLIDGLHRDDAALADFLGVLPFLGKGSIVLWHNVNMVSNAFDAGFESASALFTEHHVLRTHGPMGIFYCRQSHPLVHQYLLDSMLPWPEWRRSIDLLERGKDLGEYDRLRRTVYWQAAAWLGRPVRNILRSRRAHPR